MADYDDERAQAELDEAVRQEATSRKRTTEGHAVAAPVTPSQLLHQAAEAERAAQHFRAQAALMAHAMEEARRPVEPDASEGAVYVAFSKYQSGREYAYAAVGWAVGRQQRWAITRLHGSDGPTRYNWAALLQFMGEANWGTLQLLAPHGDPLVPAGNEPPAVEVMGNYGRVVGTRAQPFAGPGLYGDTDNGHSADLW